MAALRGYGIRSSSALEEDKLCVAQEAVSSLGLSEGRKERITHRHQSLSSVVGTSPTGSPSRPRGCPWLHRGWIQSFVVRADNSGRRLRLPGRYILSVAASYPHKRLATVFDAFSLVPGQISDLHLVLAGTHPGERGMVPALLAAAAAKGPRRSVQVVRDSSEPTCPKLRALCGGGREEPPGPFPARRGVSLPEKMPSPRLSRH